MAAPRLGPVSDRGGSDTGLRHLNSGFKTQGSGFLGILGSRLRIRWNRSGGGFTSEHENDDIRDERHILGAGTERLTRLYRLFPNILRANFSSYFSHKHSLFFLTYTRFLCSLFFYLFFPLLHGRVLHYSKKEKKEKKKGLGHACSLVQCVSCVPAVSDMATAARLPCSAFQAEMRILKIDVCFFFENVHFSKSLIF